MKLFVHVHEYELGILATFPFAVIITLSLAVNGRNQTDKYSPWFDISVSNFLSLPTFRDFVTEYKARYVLSADAETPIAVYFNQYFFFEARDSHVVFIWQLLMWTALINVDIWVDYSQSTSMD